MPEPGCCTGHAPRTVGGQGAWRGWLARRWWRPARHGATQPTAGREGRATKAHCPNGATLRGRAATDEGGATEAHPTGWWTLHAEAPATKTHGAHGRTLETQAPATKRLTAKTHAAAGRTLKAQAPAAERAAAKAHPHRRSWRAHASAPKTQASAPEATTPEAAAAPAAGGGLAP